MSDPLLGFRWVRALMRDPEVSADFEDWLSQFRGWKFAEMAGEDNPMKLHRLQGQLAAVDHIEAFIARVVAEQTAPSDKSSANGEG